MSGNKANESKLVGDELFVVESESFSDSTVVPGRTLYRHHKDAQISDTLRKKSGKFWTNPAFGKPKFTTTDYAPVKSIRTLSETVDPQTAAAEQHMELTFVDPIQADLNYEELMEFFSSDTEYSDHATVFGVYEDGNNKVEQASGTVNLYAEVKSDYNFLEKKYEEFLETTDGSIRELDLPNFYNFLIRTDGVSITERATILSLGSRIRLGDPSNVLASKMKPVGDYYNQWAENFEDYKKDEPEMFIKNFKMKNVTFTAAETDNLQELYKYKEVFPMLNTVVFNTQPDSRLGTTLEETNFSSQLRSQLKASNATALSLSEVRTNYSERFETNQDGSQSVVTSPITTSEVSVNTRTSYDVDDFMSIYESSNDESLSFNDNILPGSDYRAFYNLMSMIVKGRVEKVKKQVFRNYEEILSGTTAYNEVVFYKIGKYDVENTLLQTFNFTNTSKTELISFVDTQVKYDKRYSYRITSQNLVIGTKYSFKDPEFVWRNYKVIGLKFKVTSQPTAKIIEVPVFEKSVIIHDNPPIAPELYPVYFRGINNKIKLMFNSAVGRYKAEPVLFQASEADKIEKYKIAQDVPNSAEEIIYETDDSVTSFSLYRLLTKPESYQDFEETGRLIVIETDKASSASYLDTVSANTKYYYCLRATDYHGNLSYPSVIYEVELVDDAGSVYPTSRVVDFHIPKTKQPSLGVKRFIHIKPSFRNLLSNEVQMGIEEGSGPEVGQAVALGEGGDVTWGKKFKIRLTSKMTGKKVDFNFTFNTKPDPTISEET
jgi:hypothetical protein